jgi:ribosomal silencing factor RsfS
MEVPDFSPPKDAGQQSRNPNPSIRLTQESQGAQKERKRRSEQPLSRAEAQRRGGAYDVRCGGTQAHFRRVEVADFPLFRFRSRSISCKERKERKGAWTILRAAPICVHLRHLRLKIRKFHGMENVFSNRRNRTQGFTELQSRNPNPSIRLTQESQGAQKERKRRSEQPFSRAEAQMRGGAFDVRGGGTQAHFRRVEVADFPPFRFRSRSISRKERKERKERKGAWTILRAAPICVHLRHLRLKIRLPRHGSSGFSTADERRWTQMEQPGGGTGLGSHSSDSYYS